MLLAQSLTGKDRGEFLDSFLIADVPMLFSMLVLLAYRHVHSICPATNMEDLFGGAISFQLLVSNTIFVIIQSQSIRNAGMAIADAAPTEAEQSHRETSTSAPGMA